VKSQPAIDFAAGGDFIGHIFLEDIFILAGMFQPPCFKLYVLNGKFINNFINELINIIIDRRLAIKGGPSMGKLYMTLFVLKLYGIVVHTSDCWTKNWPALTKIWRNLRWPLLI